MVEFSPEIVGIIRFEDACLLRPSRSRQVNRLCSQDSGSHASSTSLKLFSPEDESLDAYNNETGSQVDADLEQLKYDLLTELEELKLRIEMLMRNA